MPSLPSSRSWSAWPRSLAIHVGDTRSLLSFSLSPSPTPSPPFPLFLIPITTPPLLQVEKVNSLEGKELRRSLWALQDLLHTGRPPWHPVPGV